MPSIVMPSASSSSCAWVTLAERAGAIGAHDAGPRQLELALQFAVVGQQQQALGHEIEPADRHQPRQARRQAVVDRRPALGIVRRGQRRRRLVEAEQPSRRGRPDRLAVDRHSAQILEQGRRRGELFAIERDPAFGDHPLDLAARRDCRRARAAWRCAAVRALAVLVALAGTARPLRRRRRAAPVGACAFVRCGGEVMVGSYDAVREA